MAVVVSSTSQSVCSSGDVGAGLVGGSAAGVSDSSSLELEAEDVSEELAVLVDSVSDSCCSSSSSSTPSSVSLGHTTTAVGSVWLWCIA